MKIIERLPNKNVRVEHDGIRYVRALNGGRNFDELVWQYHRQFIDKELPFVSDLEDEYQRLLKHLNREQKLKRILK
jgi:hypothetical protein